MTVIAGPYSHSGVDSHVAMDRATPIEDDEDATLEDSGSGSYVCSMSSDIDLTLRDDLTANVQDYLSRIVDELHLISRWTTDCCRFMLMHQEKQTREHHALQRRLSREPMVVAPQGSAVSSSAERLLFQTELELLRQDTHRSQHELSQRCTSALAYMQTAIRAEHDEQLRELQTQFDDKLRFFTQQTLEVLDKRQSESDARIQSVDTSIQQLQRQLADSQAQLRALEATMTSSIGGLSSSLHAQQNDAAVCIRRVENSEAALALQLSDMRSRVDDALQSLRAAQTQLSSKLQVTRMELHESANECQRKLQQLSKCVQHHSAAHQDTWFKLPASAGQVGVSMSSAKPGSSPHGAPPLEVGSGVRMSTGVAGMTALATPDCFLYAKAKLPQRDATELIAAATPALVKRAAPPTSPLRASSAASSSATAANDGHYAQVRASTSEKRWRDARPPDLDAALVIQQSVLSKPLGHEDDDVHEANEPPLAGTIVVSLPISAPLEDASQLQAEAIARLPLATTAQGAVSLSSQHPHEQQTPTASPRKLQASRLRDPARSYSTSSASSPSVTLRSATAPHRPDSSRRSTATSH